MKSPYRPQFEAALRKFAQVSGAMVAAGHSRPVLVGGGAVEIYTSSAINTGDFDIATPAQAAFEQLLQHHGFVKPAGAGVATRGWIHPELGLGFEVVASTLLDGRTDQSKLRLIDLGSDGAIAVIALEDIIADRMGQYASGSAPEMLGQAKALFILYPDADIDYMQRRITEETDGEYGIDTLRS